ncbi:MAG: hypothetical protein WCJ30_09100 [Deltaproteobacteria bacterium]
MRCLWLIVASALAACSGPTTADASVDAPVTADSPVATDVPQDVQPLACGSMTCGVDQVCVHPCSGGADAGSQPAPVCMNVLPACSQHGCTCADGYCGSQPYACGYLTDRSVRCMCA